jgi:hypothetical protein
VSSLRSWLDVAKPRDPPQAYILGTLFHYLVKKDANVEAFRKRMQRLEEYSVQRMLPYNLKLKLKMYFEFQVCAQTARGVEAENGERKTN